METSFSIFISFVLPLVSLITWSHYVSDHMDNLFIIDRIQMPKHVLTTQYKPQIRNLQPNKTILSVSLRNRKDSELQRNRYKICKSLTIKKGRKFYLTFTNRESVNHNRRRTKDTFKPMFAANTITLSARTQSSYSLIPSPIGLQGRIQPIIWP